MEEIKNTIQRVFQEWHIKNKAGDSGELGKLLKKILAKKALKHVKLYNFRNGVLSIKVDSSTWAYYLSLQKEDLLGKLRSELTTIKEIRFSLGG